MLPPDALTSLTVSVLYSLQASDKRSDGTLNTTQPVATVREYATAVFIAPQTVVVSNYYIAAPALGLILPTGTYTYAFIARASSADATFKVYLYSTTDTSFGNATLLVNNLGAGVVVPGDNSTHTVSNAITNSTPTTLTAGKYLCLQVQATFASDTALALTTGGKENITTLTVSQSM